MNVEDMKLDALAQELEVSRDDISQGYDWYGEYPIFEVGSEEYLVLTDEEADDACALSIEESLWAFNAWFIVEHSVLPNRADTIELIQGYQEDRCEDANETIKALVGDHFGDLVEDAISADGRGHFLSSYDGDEVEIDYHPSEDERVTFYIYRLN